MNSTDPLLLGIDIGTSSIKAVLVSPAGDVIQQTRQAYPTRQLGCGWVEQNPSDWWQSTIAVVQRLLEGIPPSRVVGIGVSGQGCGVTLLGSEGQVIRPAVIWMDQRAEPQCEILRQTCAEAIFRINGKQPAPYNADPKLMWLAQHEPESIHAARFSLTATAYLNFRLTGEVVMNTSDASILYAFDLRRQTWSSELIDSFGLPERLYPPVVPCHTIIGGLTAEAAVALGLPVGTPVIAGGEDTSSAGLGLGITAPGQAFLSLGTAATIYVAHPGVLTIPELLTFLHVLPGISLAGGSMVACGAALDWCRALLRPELSLEQLTEIASQAEVGSGGVIFLPYLNGEAQPVNSGQARGVFFGLNLNTTAAQLARATMEGVAFSIEHNLRVARSAGTKIERIRAVGKPALNPLWCQIIADVTGACIEAFPSNPGAPLGNALLAASALHLIDQPRVSIANHSSRTYETNRSAHEHYAQLFSIYQSLYPALQPQFTRLAQLNSTTSEIP